MFQRAIDVAVVGVGAALVLPAVAQAAVDLASSDASWSGAAFASELVSTSDAAPDLELTVEGPLRFGRDRDDAPPVATDRHAEAAERPTDKRRTPRSAATDDPFARGGFVVGFDVGANESVGLTVDYTLIGLENEAPADVVAIVRVARLGGGLMIFESVEAVEVAPDEDGGGLEAERSPHDDLAPGGVPEFADGARRADAAVEHAESLNPAQAPTPGAVGLLAFAGLAATRRRR